MLKNQVGGAAGAASPRAKGKWGGPRKDAGRKPKVRPPEDIEASTAGGARKKPYRRASRMPVVVSVRLSSPAAERIRTAAAEAGLRQSRFIRISAIERSTNRLAVIDPGERKLLADLLVELGRQGSNLNQLAFAANKVASHLNRESVMPATAKVEQAASDAQAAVDRIIELLMPLEDRLRAGRPAAHR